MTAFVIAITLWLVGWWFWLRLRNKERPPERRPWTVKPRCKRRSRKLIQKDEHIP